MTNHYGVTWFEFGNLANHYVSDEFAIFLQTPGNTVLWCQENLGP